MTHRGSRPLRAALALGLLAVLVAGCDLFKPASPEVGGMVATLLPSYASPESCLRYMRIGIERKDNVGQAAYLGALADSFHATFDPAVLSTYSGVRPEVWEWRHEAQFYSVFIRSFADPYLMDWAEDENYPIANEVNDGKTAVLHRRYKVWAQRQATGEALLIAVGYAKLNFVKISASRWALTLWEDQVDPAVGAEPAPNAADQRTFGYRRLDAGAGG
jgi:hypothetical protein